MVFRFHVTSSDSECKNESLVNDFQVPSLLFGTVRRGTLTYFPLILAVVNEEGAGQTETLHTSPIAQGTTRREPVTIQFWCCPIQSLNFFPFLLFTPPTPPPFHPLVLHRRFVHFTTAEVAPAGRGGSTSKVRAEDADAPGAGGARTADARTPAAAVRISIRTAGRHVRPKPGSGARPGGQCCFRSVGLAHGMGRSLYTILASTDCLWGTRVHFRAAKPANVKIRLHSFYMILSSDRW